MRLPRLIAVVLAAAALAAFAAPALAADGELDASFGGDGRVVSDPTPLEEFPADLTIDSQGRIIVVGNATSSSATGRGFIARYTPGGELDQSFSGDGWEFIQWGAESGTATSVTIDSKGRIVVGGHAAMPVTGFDLAAARFTGSGDFDETFSGDGRATANVLQGGTDVSNAVATDAQNRVLVAGSGGGRMAVARFTEGGALDPSFGVDEGTQPIGVPGYDNSNADGIAIDSGGRIILGGSASTGDQSDFAVVRLLGADGEFDASFGSQGRATLNFGTAPAESVRDLTIDGSGRYLLAGASGNSGSNLTLVGRLLDNGAPDISFDGDGKLIPALPEPSFAKGVAVDSAGRILTAGGIGSLGLDGALSRFDSGGATDAAFGAGGLVRDDFLASNARFEAIVVDGSGRYVVVGDANTGTTRVGMARFLTSYPAPPAGPPPAPSAPPKKCKGVRATKVGTAKRNVIRGTNKRDVIVALGGNDLIKGRGGNDLICAGAGKDVVMAGAGKDRVFGEGGRDRLLGGPGKDVLRGGPGRDIER